MISYDKMGRRIFKVKDTDRTRPPEKVEDKKTKVKDKNLDSPDEKTCLKPRKEMEVIDAKTLVGKTIPIKTVDSDKEISAFFCKVCKVTLKDNLAYLDHINGKSHNRMLGMNMRVERDSVDKVREKLLSLKRKPDIKIQNKNDKTRNIEKY